jgi:hypothetical protein
MAFLCFSLSDCLCLVRYVFGCAFLSMSYANRANSLIELYRTRDLVFQTCSRDTSFVSAYTRRLELLGLITSMDTEYHVLAELLGDAASRKTSADF